MIEFVGIQFKNPFVVASSPLTVKPELLKRAEEYGAAAVSTKLTFIKQPFIGSLRMFHNLREGSIVCHDRRLDMEEGVRLAWKLARAGDVILLSPACSSFDMFEDYRERGRTFKEIVLKLAEGEA